jgi:hypothetical protein
LKTERSITMKLPLIMTTYFRRFIVLIITCSLLSIKSLAQYDSLLNILNTNYPQEKIYIHYDRPYYNPGETIWFKAYLFSGNLPSPISTTVYAELIGEDGKIMQRRILPALNSSASSDFQLPDSIQYSTVYVRAYTSWMLNFDSSFLYLKPIRIINNKTTAAKTKKAPSYSLHFFPEGGDIINGLNSRVAFKATDDQGYPIKVKGDVFNSKNVKVASFADVHNGMGYFTFTPKAGEKYKAVWKDSQGISHETNLPDAKEKGVLLSMNNNETGLTYGLVRTEDIPANYKTLFVVGQMQQHPVYIAKVNLANRLQMTAAIPADELPDGILQVTVFTEDRIPVAERIVFINNNNYYFITDIHASEKRLTPKGKNVIRFDISDTLFTNLSVSITDAATTPPDDEEENIFSNILLSSDIKGYVHNPAYYFSGTADSLKTHLDLVMMTNGWRRFKWEEIMAGRWPSLKYFPEQYLTINGKVLGLRESEMNGKDISVILTTNKNSSQLLLMPLSPKGDFSTTGLLYYDTATLYYQINDDKDKRLTATASFDIHNNFLNVPDKPVTNLQTIMKAVVPDSLVALKNQKLTKEKFDEFYEGSRVKTLETVTVTTRTKSPQEKMEEEYTSGFFRGGDGYTFVTEDDPLARSGMTVLDYLRGKVAGLQITTNGPTGGSLSWRGGTPTLFLNEMTTDISMIQSTPMNDVAMIKVFRPPFVGAMGGGAGGAIAVYTKKGAQQNSKVTGLSFVKIAGYSPIKEFYSPDYSKDADINKGDYRTTLYWNPYIVFDKQTRALLIPFYNNDSCKKIRVVVEGVNEQGKLTREERFFE